MMKRKIYAALICGSMMFAQGFSCIGATPESAFTAAADTNGTTGAPIWNIVGGDLLTNVQTLITNLTGQVLPV